jgi:hypothetical protein
MVKEKSLSFMPERRTCSYLAVVLAAAAVTVVAMIALTGVANAKTSDDPRQVNIGDVDFPMHSWNGMQVSYTIEGANVGQATDVEGMTFSRTASGTITSRTLHVWGTWKFGDYIGDRSYSGSTDIRYVKNGNLMDGYTHLGKAEDTGGDGIYSDFDLEVQVPSDAPEIYIEISQAGNYGNGEVRNMYVLLTLENPYYGIPVSSSVPSGTGNNGGTGSSSADSPGFGSVTVILSLVLAGGIFMAGRLRK